MNETTLADIKLKIGAAVEHLKKELASIRTGRASPSLIEEIPVEAYGGRMKLMEVGTIAAPQLSLLTIQIWDASLIKAVEKAILESDLGLTPVVDGQMIRLSIPPLSEERREEFVKLAHQKEEAAKVEIRQFRQLQRESWERSQEAQEFGEDELHRRYNLLQELVDKSVIQIDNLVKAKEEALRSV